VACVPSPTPARSTTEYEPKGSLPQQATEINLDLIGNQLVHEGGGNVRAIIGLFIVQAFILTSLLTSAPASATPIPGNETGTARAVIGVLFPLVEALPSRQDFY
jgi:hypothetical protein